MTFLDPFIVPFADYAFMRRALAACLVLALGGVPLGLFLTLRRMTLAGDAMSHAILPGVALAFLASGLSVWAMTLGGLMTGIVVASLAVMLVRFTNLKEDAAFMLLYLLSLAAGVTLVSLKGSNVDLLHLLFGNILAISPESLWMITASTCLSLLVMAVLFRRLVIDGFDPDFMKAVAAHVGGGTAGVHHVFFVLLMVNLVAAFQALGTLMALGVMILPSLAARFWTRSIDGAMGLGIVLAAVSSAGGLLVSFYGKIPAAPAVVLTMGSVTFLSAIAGRYGSVRANAIG